MKTESRTEPLKHRVLAREKELETRLETMNADAAHSRHENEKKIKDTLRALETTVSDGWHNLKGATIERLNPWLRRD